MYNYKNKDNLDELISSSDNSEELSEEEIDEEEIKKLFKKVSMSKNKINMKIKDKKKGKEEIILEDKNINNSIIKYLYKSTLPYKTLPKDQLTRVYDNVP